MVAQPPATFWHAFSVRGLPACQCSRTWPGRSAEPCLTNLNSALINSTPPLSSPATIRGGSSAWCNSYSHDADARNSRGRRWRLCISAGGCLLKRRVEFGARWRDELHESLTLFSDGDSRSSSLQRGSESACAIESGSPCDAAASEQSFPASCPCREYATCSNGGVQHSGDLCCVFSLRRSFGQPIAHGSLFLLRQRLGNGAQNLRQRL